MKNILLTFIIIVFSLECKKSEEKITKSHLISDTIFLKDNNIIFVSPSGKNIDHLKKKNMEKVFIQLLMMPTVIFLKPPAIWIL